MSAYKVLREGGSAHHGGIGQWYLPVGKRPGKWMPEIANIKPCERGYHFCRHERDLIHWLGPVIWRVEVRGEIIECGDNAVASQARLIAPTPWNDRTARLFAADCAERVLLLIPEPQWEICARTIAVARGFTMGTATAQELTAACAVARGGAGALARAAVGAAAGAVARGGAGAAAWAASGALAWAAVGAAVGAGEWQAARLRQYLNGEIT